MATQLTIVNEDMRVGLQNSGFTTYDDFLSCREGEVIQQSGTTTTRRIELRHAGIADTLYLKTYRPSNLGGWRRSRPQREARNYSILRDHCGINVPETIAFGTCRAFGRWMDGFILTRAVVDAVPLDRLREGTGPLRQYLLDQTATLVSQMHAAGFYHIDLQWRNLLLANDGSSAPDIYVIDSSRGGLRRWRVLREHGRLRDLSSLAKEARHRLTSRESLRWLRTYYGVRRFTAVHRALIRTIQYDRAVKEHEA